MNRAFSKIWIIVIIGLFIVGGIFAWQYWYMPEKEDKEMPKDFGLYYSFGVHEGNILDTKNNLYVKDMVCDPSLNLTVSLSENEKKEIYNKIVESHFFSLKENMLPIGAMCEPQYGLTLRVTAAGKTKSVRWTCGYSETDPDYLKLINIITAIDNIISQKEKEMSVPEPRCAYL